MVASEIVFFVGIICLLVGLSLITLNATGNFLGTPRTCDTTILTQNFTNTPHLANPANQDLNQQDLIMIVDNNYQRR